MGNIIKNGNEVKSNLFGCYGCSDEKNLCLGPKVYSEIKIGENIYSNYNNTNLNNFKTLDMKLTPDEYIRSFLSFDKNNNKKRNNNIKVKNYNINFKEENIKTFNQDKYESNPKIKELVSLLGENNNFILSEKESFYIKNIVSKNNLTKKLLHYKDNCYYLGFIDKNNFNKELFGTYYYNDGSIYKGFFENDKINGRGRLILINRFIYEGDFEDGLFNGFGKLCTINGLKYEGNWKNDMQDGFGVEKYIDGSCYSGTFKKGIKYGKGKLIFKNGDLYEGDFENDEMTGWGIFKRKDGKIYYGMVKNHLIEGIGVFIWKDNKRYIGEYHNELKDGFGIFYTNDGRNYAGFWKEGKQNDIGIITNIYGQKYYIKYNNGEKIQGLIFSDKEKEDINKLFLKEEKRIDINKLNKIADELIMQKEKEKKELLNEIDDNNKDVNKNILIKKDSKLSDNNYNIINTNISINKNEIKNNNKKEDCKAPSNYGYSLFYDTGTSFNNILANKNGLINDIPKNNKSSSSKDGDKNTNQTSKIIGNDKYNKNKSSPNLNILFNSINKNFQQNMNKIQINHFESL